MVVPGMFDMPTVMAESGLTEDDVLNLGFEADGLVFMVVVPELGACRVPDVALSHFMAGDDEYTADGMPEHWSNRPSGPWTIKRDRLRILADSWEKHLTRIDSVQAYLDRQQADAEELRTPQSTREPGFYTLEEAARAIAVQEGFNAFHEKRLCDDMLESDRDGTLAVRDGGGYAKFAPIRPNIPRAYCELVTPSDVNEWATRRGFSWRWLLASKTAPAQTATPAPVVAASDAPAIPKNQRPDLLTPPIEKAQRGESDPFNAAVIWPKLCDMAEQKLTPFIGKTGDGLQWIDASDDPQFLSKKALSDRLRRAKKASIELAKPR